MRVLRGPRQRSEIIAGMKRPGRLAASMARRMFVAELKEMLRVRVAYGMIYKFV